MNRTPLRVLVFSSLFPNESEPFKGLFVEQRVRKWHAQGHTDTRVVAPVPWWPCRHRMFGKYGVYAAVPHVDNRSGIPILYPRYPTLPKIGMTIAPLLMALAVLPVLRKLIRRGWSFDIIDAHYFYPDGVAAVLVGRWLGKPVIVTARGSDLNLISRYRLPRQMIRWAARRAAMNVTVATTLRDRLIAIGIDPRQVQVVPNGVDTDVFAPRDRQTARAELGLPGPLLISVGRLVKGKGHDLVIEALRDLPGWHVAIIGDGEQSGLRAVAQRFGVADRVRLVGAVEQSRLAAYYCAADALVLASEMEGMPNVLLEALACGTPVVASAVGDVRQIVTSPVAGRVLTERSATAIAHAVRELDAQHAAAQDVRSEAERFSWARTTEAQLRLFAAAGVGAQ